MTLEELGRNVRKIRTARGWTINHAAKEAKIKWEQLNAIENGKGKPTVRSLFKIAIGWQVPMTDFFKNTRKAK